MHEVHGEAVQKLDEFSQHTIYRAMGHSGESEIGRVRGSQNRNYKILNWT